MIFLKLFWSFLKIGLFSFGGGYASLALIQQEIVQGQGWLTSEGFSDLVTISQMTPGPIAINAASFVGIQVAGVPGAIIATLGNVFPCIIISLLLAKLYQKFSEVPLVQNLLKGLRPAVVALIFSAAISLTKDAFIDPEGVASGLTSWNGVNLFSVFIFIISLVLYHKLKKIDPIIVMMIMGAIGGIAFYFFNL